MEPEGKYIGYISLSKGTAKIIMEDILIFLKNNGTSLENWAAIGCDGTNTNIGCNKGIIHNIQQELNKSLQWLICLLHTN